LPSSLAAKLKHKPEKSRLSGFFWLFQDAA
jgi:hypothetical protein